MGETVLGNMLGNIADTLNLQRVLSEAEYNGVISKMKDLRTIAILQDMPRGNKETAMKGLFSSSRPWTERHLQSTLKVHSEMHLKRNGAESFSVTTKNSYSLAADVYE